MVLGQILKIGTVVIKYRRQIYRVLTAQDRYIDKAMKAGGYGRQARRGVRHGALAGSLIGNLIAPETPGNDDAIPKTKYVPKTDSPYKTRGRQTSRSSTSRTKQYYPYSGKRYSRPCKPNRSRNRF